MFRGLVQKSLYEDHSKNESIMIASVFFSAIHIFAYFTAGLEQALISLTTILILSVFLGYMYAKTENLLVPALIHGCYNAALFALLYLELIGAFTMPT
jgi:membrane protease YdiL (CAAX protease family)